MSRHGPRRGPRGIFAEKSKLTRPVRTLLSGFTRYLANQKMGFLFGTIFAAVYAATSIIGPLVLAQGVDLIDDANALTEDAMLLAAVFFGLTFFGWIVQSISTRILARTRARMLFSVREDLFETLIHADMNYLKREQSGNVTARVTSDSEEVGGGIQIVIDSVIQVLVLITSFVVIIIKTHWYISLVSLAAIPIALLLSSVLSMFGRRIVIRIRRAFGEVSGKMAENLSGVTVSKSFNREGEIADELRELNRVYYGYNKQFGMFM